MYQAIKWEYLTASRYVTAYSQRRFKKKGQFVGVMYKKKEVHHTDRALIHFDDFYKSVYLDSYPSIRLGLLSPQKYCALVNNYSDADTTIKKFEQMGCLNLREQYIVSKEDYGESKGQQHKQKDLKIVKNLDKQMERVAAEILLKERGKVYGDKQESSSTVTMPDSSKELNDYLDSSRYIPAPKESGSATMIENQLSALYSYVPATNLKGMEDWVSESEYYSSYKTEGDLKVQVEPETCFRIPESINVFAFERGNISYFPSPTSEITDKLDYFLMDAASLLPVLSLDIQPGDEVLDLCAAPGAKSLTMLQTLLPEKLILNDSSKSRVNRIYKLLSQYIPESDSKTKVLIAETDGCLWENKDAYHKVLVDVPCTNDRVSVLEDDNNIFKPTRTKERLQLPQLQANLLSAGLNAVRCGGSVVYSTCSLSPVQNDGVVYMALKKVWEETKLEFVVKDLTAVLQPLKFLYKFGNHSNLKLRYGQLVLPTVINNFGPMYFSKLVRTK